jgi:hypothetical protein
MSDNRKSWMQMLNAEKLSMVAKRVEPTVPRIGFRFDFNMSVMNALVSKIPRPKMHLVVAQRTWKRVLVVSFVLDAVFSSEQYSVLAIVFDFIPILFEGTILVKVGTIVNVMALKAFIASLFHG